ncbi:aminotransferase class V-fold PLP-dependent enzyme [Victivallis sp. Marseille-Q1083]|uniref:aminotransferase class V-fold PLP-dependent enzyme n=1 Tax=Victivallis sp. Marseille-Q1083 TaxID=2717288 RepID=UPI00158E8A08|nr:aminotransferase class V-fold PLP-dependent enzyme [Victivallis sp. Marseille-Q1083]
MMIYLDHAAAMRPEQELLDYFCAAASEYYANQEAVHAGAYRVRQQLATAAAELFAALLPSANGEQREAAWAAGGSDAFGYLTAPVWPKGNLVSTALEHPALTAALRRTGLEYRTVNCPGGYFDPDHFADCLDAHTRLVAIHHVQSELGLQQDWPELASIVRRRAPQALLLADTIQSAAKLDLQPLHDVDLLTVSGHKLGAPGGGALLLNGKRAVKFFEAPLVAYRHTDYHCGRPESATMLTLSRAVQLQCQRRIATAAHLESLQQFLRRELVRLPVKLTLAPEAPHSPFICHLLLPGYQSAVVVRMLSESGILAAAGSACQAESPKPSAALLALGYRAKDAYSGLRLSFDRHTTREELGTFVSVLQKVLASY